MADDLKMAVVINAVDKASRPINRIRRSIGNLTRDSGLDRVGRRMRSLATNMRTLGSEAFTAGTQLGLAAAAVGGATWKITDDYADFADRLAKNAKAIGTDVETLQEIRHAFELGGVDWATTDKGLKYFQRRIGEAAKGSGEAKEVFEDMGVSIYDQEGRIRPTADILWDVANAFEAQEDPAKSAYAANIMFGRSGTDLAPILAQGSKKLKEQGAEMDELGKVTQEEAEAAEAYIDAKHRFTEAIKGVRNAIGAEYLDAWTAAIDKLREWTTEHRPEILEEYTKTVNAAGDAYGYVSDKLGKATETGGGWLDQLRETSPVLDDLITDLEAFVDRVGWGAIIGGAVGLGLTFKVLKAVGWVFKDVVQLAWRLGAVGVWTFEKLTQGAIKGTAKLWRMSRILRQRLIPDFTKLRDFLRNSGDWFKRPKWMDRLKPNARTRAGMPPPDEVRAQFRGMLGTIAKRSPITAALIPSKLADATIAAGTVGGEIGRMADTPYARQHQGTGAGMAEQNPAMYGRAWWQSYQPRPTTRTYPGEWERKEVAITVQFANTPPGTTVTTKQAEPDKSVPIQTDVGYAAPDWSTISP